MINLSEKVADSYRTGNKATANPNNAVTSRRRKLYGVIKSRTGGDPDAELEYAMKIIAQERPKIESYVMSKNEVPAGDVRDLAIQAYKLRCKEIDDTAHILNVSDSEAGIFIEDDEADNENANSSETDNFIGELFAPVGIAAKHLQKNSGNPDNFVDPNLLGGIINTIGNKVNAADLKRAAQDKAPGILGFLGTGGNAAYNALRNYFKQPANADEKAKVLAGIITDQTQLRGYGTAIAYHAPGTNVAGVDVVSAIEAQKKQEAIKKALPFIIIGIVVIIVVTILIVRRGNKSK